MSGLLAGSATPAAAVAGCGLDAVTSFPPVSAHDAPPGDAWGGARYAALLARRYA
jgi:hypothetical protein